MKLQTVEKEIHGVTVLLFPLVIFLCIAFFLNLQYSLPLRDSFFWYLGVFFCFYIPGNLLARYIGLNEDEFFVNLFHSGALGAALLPLVYIIFRRIGHPKLITVFLFILFVLWIISTARDLTRNRGNIRASFLDILAGLQLLVFVLLILHVSYFTDVIFTSNGFKLRTTYLTETVFHLGIINTLKDMFPPLYPYVSGAFFSHYHLNMHLEIEMFNRIFSIDTLKLTFFYFPLLYFCLLVFMPYMYVRKYCRSRHLGLVIAIAIFGTDLSFIPGLLGIIPQDVPWNAFLTTTIWSLLSLNGLLPSLFIMFLSIFYLKKFSEEGRFVYLLMFSALAYSAYGFKSSMGPHILFASFLAGVVCTALMKDHQRGKSLAIVSVLTVSVMVIDVAFLRGNMGNTVLNIEVFNRFRDSLTNFGIMDLPWVFYPVFFPVYVIATFGSRLLGFRMLKDIVKGRHFDVTVIFLMIFVASGFLISEFVFLGSAFYKRNNDAVWFSVQALAAAWILVAYFLWALRHDRKKYCVLLVAVILLSSPATAQFLTIRFDPHYYTVSSAALEVVRYLETSSPGSVVLHPPNYDEPSLAANFAGRPSVHSIFKSFASANIGPKEIKNRSEDIEFFFDSTKKICRSTILKKYDVDYVYAPVSFAPYLSKEPALVQVLKNRSYIVYKVKSDRSGAG